MYIYADVLFAVNFFMDSFIFFLTSKFTGKKIPLLRIILGGGVSAFLYCLLFFIPYMNKAVNFFFGAAILSCGVFTAFLPKSFKEFFKIVIFAHIAAFALGGLALFLYYFTDFSSYFSDDITPKRFSFKILLISTAFFYFFLKFGAGYINVNFINKRNFCRVNVTFLGKTASVCALIDSGNHLLEPKSGYPAVVCEFSALKKLFDNDIIIDFYKKGRLDFDFFLNSFENREEKDFFRVIPFRSLGKEDGRLLGFFPTQAEVVLPDGRAFKTKNVFIGLCGFSLCTGKGYNALINPDSLNEN